VEEQPIDCPDAIESSASEDEQPPRAVAPAWHTIVFMVAVIVLSWRSADRFQAGHGEINRPILYATMAASQLVMIAWVLIGLRIRKVHLHSITGVFRWNPRALAVDLGIATLFWICSMMVLASFGVMWMKVEQMIVRPHAAPITMQSAPIKAPPPAMPVQSPSIAVSSASSSSASTSSASITLRPKLTDEQRSTLAVIGRLAPANAWEVMGWILLSLLAGCCEEIVFRGYLQRQFVTLMRGGLVGAVLLSALCFGAAHAYQGARGMFLIGIYGVLFSLLALVRGSLRPGMIAHGWHDLMTGLAVAMLHAYHVF